MTTWIVLGALVLLVVVLSVWRRRQRGSGTRGDYAIERAARAQTAREGGRGFFDSQSH